MHKNTRTMAIAVSFALLSLTMAGCDRPVGVHGGSGQGDAAGAQAGQTHDVAGGEGEKAANVVGSATGGDEATGSNAATDADSASSEAVADANADSRSGEATASASEGKDGLDDKDGRDSAADAREDAVSDANADGALVEKPARSGSVIGRLAGALGVAAAGAGAFLLEKFDAFRMVDEERAFVAKDGKYALAKAKDGELLTGFDYDAVGRSMTDRYVFGKNGKFGLVDGAQKELAPFEYDAVRVPDRDHAFVKKDGKWGLINLKESGRRLDPLFDGVQLLAPGLVAVNKDGKWAVFDENEWPDASALKFEYDDVPDLDRYETAVLQKRDVDKLFGPDLRIRVIKDGKYGFLDSKGKLVIPLAYSKVDSFGEDGLARVYSKAAGSGAGDKAGSGAGGGAKSASAVASSAPAVPSGWIDIHGKEVVPASDGINYVRFDKIFLGRGADGRIAARSEDGKPIDLSAYDDLGFYGEGLIPVRSNGLWGFVDVEGKVKIKPAFERVSGFCRGRAVVGDEGLYGLIDSTGAYKVLPQYEAIRSPNYPFENDKDALAVVKQDGKWGVVDMAGNTVIPAKYDDVRFDSSGLVFAKTAGKVAVLDLKGQEQLAPKYAKFIKDGYYFHAKLDAAKDGPEDLYRVMNLEKINKEPHQDHVVMLDKSVWVKSAGKWGLIDMKGGTIAQPRWDEVEPGYDVPSPVKRDGKWGLVDLKGKEILEPAYQKLELGAELTYPAQKDGKWGLIDASGRELAKFEYEAARPLDEDHYLVKKAGKWGVVDLAGRIQIPVDYELVNLGEEGDALRKDGVDVILARWSAAN